MCDHTSTAWLNTASECERAADIVKYKSAFECKQIFADNFPRYALSSGYYYDLLIPHHAVLQTNAMTDPFPEDLEI